jgi:hypothetical protein
MALSFVAAFDWKRRAFLRTPAKKLIAAVALLRVARAVPIHEKARL